MTLVRFPTNTRNQIEEIIGQIGRNVEFFYVFSSQACPICNLDPVTNSSTDSLCPVCSGTYWIDVYSGVTMSAHITWKYDYRNEYETGGLVFLGDAKVKVMHTPEREQLIKQAKYLIMDGKTMDIENTTLLGAPAINRIIIDVKEREE